MKEKPSPKPPRNCSPKASPSHSGILNSNTSSPIRHKSPNHRLSYSASSASRNYHPNSFRPRSPKLNNCNT